MTPNDCWSNPPNVDDDDGIENDGAVDGGDVGNPEENEENDVGNDVDDEATTGSNV
jgi:hypothetical protein